MIIKIVTISLMAVFYICYFAHLYICINNVSCLCGDNAASGSSKRYKPFGYILFCANARKLSPCDFS